MTLENPLNLLTVYLGKVPNSHLPITLIYAMAIAGLLGQALRSAKLLMMRHLLQDWRRYKQVSLPAGTI